ncbi:MAG: 50S ribosomal protein L21 [Gammaproteobacteria bacterium]|nr:50S ribosomal protein L21 [Gammaproteobacteria bacterium]
MYAVIQTGGKQYKVSPGQRLKVEQLAQAVGDRVQFDKILAFWGDSEHIGAPYLENCVVNATVVSHGRHDKIRIIKFRRRKHYKKQMGWRQNYTEVKIDEILNNKI